MDRKQAEAMADAVLAQPTAQQRERQQRLQQQRAAAAEQLARKRVVAWLSLAGMITGAGLAWAAAEPVVTGLLWGGLGSASLGWLIVGLTAPRGR